MVKGISLILFSISSLFLQSSEVPHNNHVVFFSDSSLVRGFPSVRIHREAANLAPVECWPWLGHSCKLPLCFSYFSKHLFVSSDFSSILSLLSAAACFLECCSKIKVRSVMLSLQRAYTACSQVFNTSRLFLPYALKLPDSLTFHFRHG